MNAHSLEEFEESLLANAKQPSRLLLAIFTYIPILIEFINSTNKDPIEKIGTSPIVSTTKVLKIDFSKGLADPMKNKIEPRKLKGFLDWLPTDYNEKSKIINTTLEIAQLSGYKSIGTPALEYSEVLLGVGGETDKQVFRFNDNGNRDVALRFDLTIPFARFVAEHYNQLSFPFKRVQVGDVWRAEKPQRGRYRQFTQCDLDAVGTSSLEADVDILFTLHCILNSIGVGPFTVSIGHRQILSELIKKTMGIDDPNRMNQVLILIDKISKIGTAQVIDQLNALVEKQPVESGAAELVETIVSKSANPVEAIRPIAKIFKDSSAMLSAIDQLTETVTTLSQLTKESIGKFKLDLSIARGLGYYTGIVFETTIDSLPSFGSICSGGRYDSLVERFINKPVSGIGGSIGTDRLIAAKSQLSLHQENSCQGVFIALSSREYFTYALKIAKELRGRSIPADLAIKISKISNQLKLANKLCYQHVIIIGTNEAQSATITIKNMFTGEQRNCINLGEAITSLTRGTNS